MSQVAIQLDFDGTITDEDVSYLLLDTYVGTAWHRFEEDYAAGRISVGAFNREVFGLMKADRQTMIDLVLTSDRVVVRPGFKEFIDYCNEQEYKVIITSNGLTFYIQAILSALGITGVEIYAAESRFSAAGMSVRYIGPDGQEAEDGLKESYTRYLKGQGYRVVYAGDGNSDIYPARQADYVFASQTLLKLCREENLTHYTFTDFKDILATLKTLDLN